MKALDLGHHRPEKTFITFLESVRLEPEELNRLSMEKIVEYLQDFREKPRVEKLSYIRYVVRECSKRGYLNKECLRALKPTIEEATRVEDGYLDIDRAVELMEELLRSPVLSKYAPWKRY
ncbi:MAG: hypothetical protein DRH15_06570 [Deltaproteobacteria bacterium]|nr:MAG: hypothetical protein DRH15_06570 [Deltaproteobacteria bacterium]